MERLILYLFLVASAGLAWVPAHAHVAAPEALRGRYFMIVWAYEGPGNPPMESHTFATFYNGDDLAQGLSKPVTISWLPATGVVRLLRVERGRNFSLAQTLAMACQTGKQIA